MPTKLWLFSHASRCCAARAVTRVGDVGAEDQSARRRRRRLAVFRIGANVTHVREREGDDLACIGRVCQDFLVAGDRGVETDLADERAAGADAAAPHHRAVDQNEYAGRTAGRGGGELCGGGGGVGHGRVSRRRFEKIYNCVGAATAEICG